MRLIVLLFAAVLIAWGVWTLVAREEAPSAVVDESPPAPAEQGGDAARDAADSALQEAGDALDRAGEAASGLAEDTVEAGRAAADAVGEQAGELRREIESLVEEATETDPAPPAEAPAN